MLNILHIFNTMSEGISILTSGWSHLSQLWITASDVITALHQRSAKVKDDLMPLLESWTQSVVSLGLWPSRWSTGESQAAQRHFLSTSEATLMFKPVQTAGNHRSKALCILKYIYYSSSSLIKYPSFKTLLRVCVCVCTHTLKENRRSFICNSFCTRAPGFALDCLRQVFFMASIFSWLFIEF